MKKLTHFTARTGVVTAASGIADWHIMAAGLIILVVGIILIMGRKDDPPPTSP